VRGVTLAGDAGHWAGREGRGGHQKNRGSSRLPRIFWLFHKSLVFGRIARVCEPMKLMIAVRCQNLEDFAPFTSIVI